MSIFHYLDLSYIYFYLLLQNEEKQIYKTLIKHFVHFFIGKQLYLREKQNFHLHILVYETHITKHFCFDIRFNCNNKYQRRQTGGGKWEGDRDRGGLFFIKSASELLCLQVWIHQDCVSSTKSWQVTNIGKFSCQKQVLLQRIPKGRNAGGWTVNEGFTMKLSGLDYLSEKRNLQIQCRL